jgi:hypothetical protein
MPAKAPTDRKGILFGIYAINCGIDIVLPLGIVCPETRNSRAGACKGIENGISKERQFMNELLGLTKLLYSCWILSGNAEDGHETIPTGGSVLDYALQEALQKATFPAWVSQQLHFVSGDTGLVCLELPSIEKLATEIKFTSDPNPSYTRTHIVVGKDLARRCLGRMGIPEKQAKEWGAALRSAVDSAEKQLQLA